MRKLWLILIIQCIPNLALACACGCGIFDVGTSSMFPSGQGGTVSEEYDFMDQTRNWRNSDGAASQDNDDKRIQSSFMVTGLQYMFNRDWGIQVELPYDHRYFKTTDDDTGDIVDSAHSALGDLRLEGIYTGFSPDLSTGITFGFKVPTGDWKFPAFDRDVQTGSGSTDALLGAFHRGAITSDGSFNYFIQDSLDQPFLTQGGYLPGTENDAALGVYYKGWSMGQVRATPIGEVLNSYRTRDRGWAADPTDSGYERVLLEPAMEVDYKKLMVFFGVGFPVYQYTNGDQLVASPLYKVTVSYMF